MLVSWLPLFGSLGLFRPLTQICDAIPIGSSPPARMPALAARRSASRTRYQFSHVTLVLKLMPCQGDQLQSCQTSHRCCSLLLNLFYRISHVVCLLRAASLGRTAARLGLSLRRWRRRACRPSREVASVHGRLASLRLRQALPLALRFSLLLRLDLRNDRLDLGRLETLRTCQLVLSAEHSCEINSP